MRIGVGVDQRLGLSIAQLRDLAPYARDLGYESIWTNASLDYDPVAMCVAWHATSGLATGVSVVPIARNPAAVLALAGRTAHALTGGTFTLGIGAGSITEKPIAAVRAYLRDVRRLAPDVPILVGALGPRMLRLAGRETQGAALNWCTPEQVAWSREQAGPRALLVDYIRVCVDDDVAAARRAVALQILAYALLVRPSGASGYRKHFERMGFSEEVAYLGSRRAAGAGDDELIRAMPERLLRTFGYAGRGDGARDWFAQMAAGLDVAIVRVLTPRPGDLGPVRAAILTFAPPH
ncbi:MAG TPA: LLM class flavin-dependent oxidoreductase [Candidatus Limnocylindria bacterium]|nr:LLM class flavin-dependent oxidoreductase [Candidatus Limnocylindria bacterium]